MGTKNNPGEYDCYDKAEPDEPLFTLLARDPAAPATVRFWVAMRGIVRKADQEKHGEALDCAAEMQRWYELNIGEATASSATIR